MDKYLQLAIAVWRVVRRTLAAAPLGCALAAIPQAAPPPLAATTSARERELLDAGWAFQLGDVPGAEAPGFDARSWRRVDLPHDWSIEGTVDVHAPSAGPGGFFPTGVGWYRRTFVAPPASADRRVEIEFEGVYMNAEVWLNGVALGSHPYGYTPFRFDLTPHLKPGGENVLAVRVDNSQQVNSRWYSGSGIYRHVWLDVTGPIHVAPWGVWATTTALAADFAIVRIETTVLNDSFAASDLEVETVLNDPAGRTVATVRAAGRAAPGGAFVAAPEAKVAQPLAWSPETPALYRAVTRVRAGGQVVDETLTTFGIRTVRVSAARGFELNGRSIELLGGNVHHDDGVLGAAAFDRAEARKVELLKGAGFNAVRTAHNPPSTAFLDACDRLGLLVLDEAFDGWEKAKNKHDYSVVFAEWSQRDVEALVRRDRSHPSVVLWSLGNEVYERGSPSGARIAKALSDRIRQLDPSRPISAGLNGMGKGGDWTKVDPVFATLDVAGYNYEIARHAEDHARLPERVIMVAESYQSEAFANWAIAHDQSYVIGDFVWSGLDYLGEAGIGRVFPPGEPVVKHWEGNLFPWHGAYCGDIDITGWRKPVSHYRAIVWDRGEKLYAAVIAPSPNGEPWGVSPWAMPPAMPSWTWPGHEGQPLTVEVYSRHDAVRLYANGKLVGEKPTTRAEEFKATFVVPYAPGELKAVGVQAGREVETFVLPTAGAVARLRLTADRAQLNADGQDLAYVTVEAVDAKGVVVPNADAPVQFALTGPATFAGIGTGDLASLEGYRANPHRLFQGRALVVLRTTDAASTIRLTANLAGGQASEISLNSVAAN